MNEKLIREFLENFRCRIMDSSRRSTVKCSYTPAGFQEVFSQPSFATERLYIMEIAESDLRNLARWYEYMDQHFSPEPREFFETWWRARETEADLRAHHPAVAAAYDQYKTLLILAASDPSKLDTVVKIPD
jgi:hypothetical protein